jgi:hypothetical protein
MPKVTINDSQGLVQSTGSGLEISSTSTLASVSVTGAATLTSATVSSTLNLGGTGLLYGQKRSSSILTSGTVLTSADSGKVFYLVQSAAGARSATLPALEAGLNFKFILNTAAAGNWSIATAQAADDFVGSVVSADGGAGDSATDSDTVVRFASTTAAAGDQVELECDGTDWYIRGSMKVAGGIVFA